jgi:hypothetical protein
MPTTAQQDREFLGTIINSTLLEEAIEWIANNMNPEDVFSESQLDEWAVDNDWVEAETL